jgi:hypothetical protein
MPDPSMDRREFLKRSLDDTGAFADLRLWGR